MSSSHYDSSYEDRQKHRNALGHAWMMCNDCGAKLYDFDGYKDMSKNCPYVRDEKGRCTDKLK